LQAASFTHLPYPSLVRSDVQIGGLRAPRLQHQPGDAVLVLQDLRDRVVEHLAADRLRVPFEEVHEPLVLEVVREVEVGGGLPGGDRKSTRLNSSHVSISY